MHQEELTSKFKIERIIALKRYEQPPPGYFHLLPSRIITRIEKGEQPNSFWEKLWPNFAVRPSLAYALGLTVCGALTAGIFYAPARSASSASADAALTARWAVASTADDQDTEEARAHGLRVSSGFDSTLPVSAPRSSGTFTSFPEARAVPVSVYMHP